MSAEARYSPRATRDLRELDRKVATKIYMKIEFYAQQDKPLAYAQKLDVPFERTYRFRIGDYRVLFEIEKGGTVAVLEILRIGHRREIYNR